MKVSNSKDAFSKSAQQCASAVDRKDTIFKARTQHPIKQKRAKEEAIFNITKTSSSTNVVELNTGEHYIISECTLSHPIYTITV